MKFWLLAGLAAVCLAAPPRIEVPEIIQLSVEANGRDWRAAPEYSYFAREQTGSGSKTYQVLMILGSPFRKLVAINGEPLSAAQQRKEQIKLERAIARRRRESSGARAARIEDYRRERRQEHVLLNQLTQAFDFRLLGQGLLNGREVYMLQATPRRGYRPPNRDSKVLIGMQGELWIDTQTYQWVKVEAEVIHPVWIEGFLARVEPGTRFELEYGPVTDEVWLPAHYAMQSRATVLFLFGRKDREEESYFGYRKAARLVD